MVSNIRSTRLGEIRTNMAADNKSFITRGEFNTIISQLFGNEIITPDENYDPNGIIPGERGHYTDPVAKTGWTTTHEVLTVLTNSIKRDGYFKFNAETYLQPLAVGDAFVVGDPFPSSKGGPFCLGIDNKIGNSYYSSGLKTDTQLLYKWTKS